MKYCNTCGRVIGSRRSNAAKSSQAEAKYCSDKCKRHKPSTTSGSIEKQIEEALFELLKGRAVQTPSEAGTSDARVIRAKSQPKKGDPRTIVQLSEVEEAVFGNRRDPGKMFGRRRNRARRGVPDALEWKSVDMVDAGPGATILPPSAEMPYGEEDENIGFGTDDVGNDERFVTDGVSLRVRPKQSQSEVNFSVGGERGWSEKIEESPEMQQKRLEGSRRADEKEMVKQAARRAIVFGLSMPSESQPVETDGKSSRKRKNRTQSAQSTEPPGSHPALRKCEALMNNIIVEPSFAKGDWSIRWREE